MDNLSSKKEDYGLGSIQVRVMPDNNAGNPPEIKTTNVVAPQAVSPATTNLPPNASILAQRLSDQKKPKKLVKKRATLLAVVLLLVIIGGGAYWYYAYGQTMLLIRQMFVNIQLPYDNLKSDFDFSIDMKFKKASSDQTNPVDIFLPSSESVKFSMSGTQHLLGNDFDGNLEFSINTAMDSFKIENGVAYKQIGKDVYFKFDRPLPTEFFGDYIDLSEFFVVDRWLSWSWDDLEKASKDNFLMLNTDNFKQEKIEKDRERIDQYFREFDLHKIFKIVDAKESKDTKDGKLKKLQFFVQPDQTTELLAMLAIFNPDYLNNEELKTSQDIKKKILDDLKKSSNSDIEESNNIEDLNKVEEFLGNLDIYVWVNTKTKNIQGVDLVADGDALDIDGDKIIITGHYRFLNEAEEGHTISKPENTISVQEAYQRTMNKIEEKRMEMYKQYEEQNSKDSDNDGLSDIMESYYGTNPNKADSDGDGFEDGEEVDNGYNPLGPGKLDFGNIRS